MANTGRNFSLTEHQQRFVSEQVTNGRHASGSEGHSGRRSPLRG